MKKSTITTCVLLLLGVFILSPRTTSAALPSTPKEHGSFNIKIEPFGSEEMVKKFEEVEYDWTKLSAKDQEVFKKSFSQLDDELKQANKSFRKAAKIFRKAGAKIHFFNKNLFSKKFIRKVSKFAETPETLTPQKAKNLNSELHSIVYEKFLYMFRGKVVDFSTLNPDYDTKF